jgi:hypothetical protein
VVFEENMPSWQLLSEKCWELMIKKDEISEIHLKFEIILCLVLWWIADLVPKGPGFESQIIHGFFLV